MKAALTLLACAAWHASAAGAALGLAGEQLFALPPEPVVRRVLQDLPSLRLGGLQQELAVAERSRLHAGLPHANSGLIQ